MLRSVRRCCLFACLVAVAWAQQGKPDGKHDGKHDGKRGAQDPKPVLSDKPTETPSDFARFVTVGEGGHFDTAITTYRNANGVEVVLFGAVHIADAQHYALLQERFGKCQRLLYELVGPEDYRPKKGEGGTGSFISMLQTGMKTGLELEFQLDAVDYEAANFVHADMTPKEFQESMDEHGESLLSMMWKVGMQSMKGAVNADGEQSAAPPVDLVKAFRTGEGRHRLRLLLASQLEQLEAAAGGEGSTLLEGRNEKCLEVLQREIAAGHKQLGIYYGAAHLSHMEKRLCDDLGFKKVGHEWLVAWDCAPRPDPKVDRELWAARRKAGDQVAAIAEAVKAWREGKDNKLVPTFAELQQPRAAGERPWYPGATQDPWGHDYVIAAYARMPWFDVQCLGQDGVKDSADDKHSATPRQLTRMRAAEQADRPGSDKSGNDRSNDKGGDKPGPGPVAGLLDDLHKEARAAKLTKAKVDVKQIASAAKVFKLNNNRLPTLEELATPDANGRAYLDNLAADPWGNDYVIQEGERGLIEVLSAGPDGKLGTADDLIEPPLGDDPTDPVGTGKRLYRSLCASCHLVDGRPLVGPSWLGLFVKDANGNIVGGRRDVLIQGQKQTITVDEAHIAESVRTPGAKKAFGFEKNTMTPFPDMTHLQISRIVAYMKSLAK